MEKTTGARLTGAFVSLMILAGCVPATPPEPLTARDYTPAIPCVDSLEQVVPRPLPPRNRRDEPVAVNIEDVAACLTHEGGEVEPVALFDLGERSGATRLELEILPFDQQVMAVQVALLDASLNVQREIPFEGFRRRPGSHTRTIYLNPQDQSVRYALIRPDRIWVGRRDERIAGQTATTPLFIPVTGGVLMGSVQSGYEIKSQRVYGEVGRIRIWLEAHSVQRLDDGS